MADLIFILTADSLGILFRALFPLDLSKLSISVIFHFTLIAVILVSRKADKMNSALLAFLTGCIMGHRSNHFLLETGIIYLFIIVLVNQCFKHTNESLIENITILVSAILIQEIMIYVLMIFYHRTGLSLSNWLFKRCMPTLLGNLIPCWILIVLNGIKEELIQRKEQNRREKESLFFAVARIKKK